MEANYQIVLSLCRNGRGAFGLLSADQQSSTLSSRVSISSLHCTAEISLRESARIVVELVPYPGKPFS